MMKRNQFRDVTDKELDEIKIIKRKPIKIKQEKLDKMKDVDTKSIVSYNIYYGRAGRRHNKSEHFSDQS